MDNEAIGELLKDGCLASLREVCNKVMTSKADEEDVYDMVAGWYKNNNGYCATVNAAALIAAMSTMLMLGDDYDDPDLARDIISDFLGDMSEKLKSMLAK